MCCRKHRVNGPCCTILTLLKLSFSSTRHPPSSIKSVLELLYHVFAVKYKKISVVLVKITKHIHILG